MCFEESEPTPKRKVGCWVRPIQINDHCIGLIKHLIHINVTGEEINTLPTQGVNEGKNPYEANTAAPLLDASAPIRRKSEVVKAQL